MKTNTIYINIQKWINSKKYVQGLYEKSYKTIMKKIEEPNKWRYI
jgi:hypothetical protein